MNMRTDRESYRLQPMIEQISRIAYKYCDALLQTFEVGRGSFLMEGMKYSSSGRIPTTVGIRATQR